jgi:hypothetical protein
MRLCYHQSVEKKGGIKKPAPYNGAGFVLLEKTTYVSFGSKGVRGSSSGVWGTGSDTPFSPVESGSGNTAAAAASFNISLAACSGRDFSFSPWADMTSPLATMNLFPSLQNKERKSSL